MHRLIVVIPLLVVLLVLGRTKAIEVNQEPLTKILSAVVADGRVDYAALKASHLQDLQAYLDTLAAIDPAPMERDAQLAFYINLYNATVLKAVAERYEPGYSVKQDDFKLFKEPLVRYAGKTISLDDLEKKVILPRFKDPRVHAVLVCAARSCPKLRQTAYTAEELDEQLDVAMNNWVNDATLNKIDHANRRMRISEIFKWYAADFGGEGKLAEYVDRYHSDDLAGYSVEFEPYDWSLNSR